MTPQHIVSEWNACREWLLPALEDATEDEVLNELLTNRAQLWRGDTAAMVTQLIGADPPNVTCWLGGGEMRGLLALQPGVEAWARWHGAKEARINGRDGWERIHAKTGFEPCDGELKKVL